MKILEDMSIFRDNEQTTPSPKPLVIITTEFKNPRLKDVTINTAGNDSTINGTFAIDVTNKGLLPTRGTRVSQATITLQKDQSSLNVGKIEEPKSLPNIPPGETKTIKIGFERNSTVVNQLVNDICEEGTVTADVEITIAELLLAATYSETVDLAVNNAQCQTLRLDITGQNQVNVGETYEWFVSAIGEDEITDVEWDMGDGSTKTGKTIQHTYDSEGTYNVSVEIPSGISTDMEVSAESLPLGIVGNTNPILGQSSAWRATGNVADEASTLTWSMGDGSESKQGSSINHTYTSPGTYIIELSTDSGESTTLEVNAEFPDVDVNINGESSVIFGESNSFSAVGSQLGVVEKFQWSMGDATIKEGRNISHVYSADEAATYEVSVNAIMYEQTVDTDTLTVNAGFSDITVDLQDTRTVQSNSPTDFSATVDNVEDATNFIWRMGDGTTYRDENGDLGGNPATVTHTYESSSGGEPYQVTAEAYIDGNLINSDSMAVSVETFLI